MLSLATLATTVTSCPAVEPLGTLNLTEFTKHTWHIQQQQITGYQPLDSLYCVTATYYPDEDPATGKRRTVPFFSGEVIGTMAPPRAASGTLVGFL